MMFKSLQQVQRIDSYRQLNPTPFFFFKLCLIRLHTTEIVIFGEYLSIWSSIAVICGITKDRGKKFEASILLFDCLWFENLTLGTVVSSLDGIPIQPLPFA
ncbi:hypothetical protein ACOSQ2_001795 [Xanthoceras sorbifolium]